MSTPIHVESLWKRYGDLEAVRGIDLDVREGEVFGLIGPDGAGKTSTFQILAGVMEASRGSAAIFGRPSRDMRAQIGYLTQSFTLYPDLTVGENVRYIAELHHVSAQEIAARGRRYLELFGLQRFADRLAGQLSGGMKQKLALACALVPQPRVLLLDEPTTGVDPVSRRDFWNVLAGLAAQGLTIVIATPYLDEAERCDRVALMHNGEIHRLGTAAGLRRGLLASRLEVRGADLAETERVLRGVPGEAFIEVQRFGDRVDLVVGDADVATNVVQQSLPDAEIRVEEPTLENVFVATLREAGLESADVPFPARRAASDRNDQIAIGARNLTKSYGSFSAVQDLSVEVRHGEIYGLLGANGAGKTTTIKMLCGLIPPTAGDIQLAGERGSLRSTALRRRIGYMSQKFSLYDDLTIAENLQFFAGIYGVPQNEREEKLQWVLDFAGMQDRREQLTGSLPGGLKQRVAFGAAIMHEPDVLFLDEPTSGVDPLARRALWRMINRLADDGTAILVTTHYLEEAEQCNRLGFMAAGKLVAEGTPTGIKQQQTGHLLEIAIDNPRRAAEFLAHDADRWTVSFFGSRLHIVTDEAVQPSIDSITAWLRSGDLRVTSAREIAFSLDDVFQGLAQ